MASNLPENGRGVRRAEFERLISTGMFEDARIELLDGHLVEMPPHSKITAHLGNLLLGLLAGEMFLRRHTWFRADEWSVPEPDLTVIPVERGYYPTKETVLVVEVADGTLHNDRVIKAAIYARAGVREYWIVNVADRTVDVLTQPSRDGYGATKTLAAGETLRPTLIPDAALDVAVIFDC